MKRLIRGSQDIMAMANVNKVRTGLKVNIWSDGQGCLRNKPDVLPRVKLDGPNGNISVSIAKNPEVLAPRDWRERFKQSDIDDFKEAMAYVGENSDLFLKHYNDTDFSFDDQTLFDELRNRGAYK